MRIIAELTDKVVLGRDGISTAKPRYTARAIVRNGRGLYAVMYADRHGLWSLPGGGMEPGEDPVTALRREVWEETGCLCGEITELGCVRENRAHANYTQESYYYEVTAAGDAGENHLTAAERASGTSVHWRTLGEVYALIAAPEHTTTQRRFLQARDLAVLEEYVPRYLPLSQLQPSQFWVSQEKLDGVMRWFDPEDLSAFQPLLIKWLNGRLTLLDGHARALVALRAGLERVPLCWEREEWNWALYRRCTDAAVERDVRSVADLEGRVLSAEAYRTKWLDWYGRAEADLSFGNQEE